MDVRLSPEQIELRASVSRAVADLGPRSVGELDDELRVHALDRAVDAAGWRQLRLPVDDGGEPWGSGVEVAVIAEALARGVADSAFLGPTLAADIRRRAGSPSTDRPETILMTSRLTQLADDEDDGEAVAIDAAGASSALGLARTADGWRVTTTPLALAAPTVDLTRPVASPAGPSSPIADQSRLLTHDDIDRVTALGLATAAADLVGTMDGALHLAIDYVTQRHQYGRPVGSFQAVHHLLADAFALMEGSRSAVLHASWGVDVLPAADALAAASVAMAYSARSARSVCETVIQVHGGIGNTWECLAHVFLRRALLSSDLFGGIPANLDRVLAHHDVRNH